MFRQIIVKVFSFHNIQTKSLLQYSNNFYHKPPYPAIQKDGIGWLIKTTSPLSPPWQGGEGVV